MTSRKYNISGTTLPQWHTRNIARWKSYQESISVDVKLAAWIDLYYVREMYKCDNVFSYVFTMKGSWLTVGQLKYILIINITVIYFTW
jgi:hypothetical protein